MSGVQHPHSFDKLAFAVVLGAAFMPSIAQARELRPMAFANWVGGSYADDNTQKFSHCVLNVPYNSGISLFVGVTRDWRWNLGFFNSKWNLQPGSQVPVQIAFDGRAPYAGTADVAAASFVLLPMAPTSQLVGDFRKSSGMTVVAGGMTFPFALTHTSKVMLVLGACVRAELAYEQGGPVPDLGIVAASVSPSPAPRPRPLNPIVSNQPSAAAPAADSPNSTLLAATQIASNLLLQAKLPNAHLLTVDETPDSLKGFGVAWASDAGSGAVKIVDAAPGETAQDIASQLISADASTCKGDFASGRSSDLVDNSIVTKAFVACKQSSGLKSARYLIYQGGAAHFIVFDTVTPEADERPSSEAPPTETKFQAAALRAVSYETWK